MKPNSDHLKVLEQGKVAWNSWRASNQGITPQLAGADLTEINLTGMDLSGANLEGAELCDINLASANLKMANLSGADLSGADLTGAALYKACLSQASLIGADLSGADLSAADLSGADLRGTQLQRTNLSDSRLTSANLNESDLNGADLSRADITGASLLFATVASANLAGLTYGSFRSMRGRYHGIRGLESCFGNAIFARDAADQDYLDNMEHQISETKSSWIRGWRRIWFSAWSLIDYGRSLLKPAVYALLLSLLFGLIYLLDMRLGWEWMDYSSSAESPFTPFYYSIVTYTTLGFGDITPRHWIGEVIIVCEVILGYTTLGLLLSILANKVARRS